MSSYRGYLAIAIMFASLGLVACAIDLSYSQPVSGGNGMVPALVLAGLLYTSIGFEAKRLTSIEDQFKRKQLQLSELEESTNNLAAILQKMDERIAKLENKARPTNS